jgi:hypothetical protein
MPWVWEVAREPARWQPAKRVRFLMASGWGIEASEQKLLEMASE